jgi:hypothetical protein
MSDRKLDLGNVMEQALRSSSTKVPRPLEQRVEHLESLLEKEESKVKSLRASLKQHSNIIESYVIATDGLKNDREILRKKNTELGETNAKLVLQRDSWIAQAEMFNKDARFRYLTYGEEQARNLVLLELLKQVNEHLALPVGDRLADHEKVLRTQLKEVLK